MARIVGINLDPNKPISSALTAIYGIGRSTANNILESIELKPNTKTKDISASDVEKIRAAIEAHKVEGDLRVEVIQNIKRLKEIGAYRGVRHARNLPVHGQRTKTNARTKRGKKVTVGSGRKKAAEKT
ncbi:30S ribosomal protein S13 [Patescibacteria group bacterium]|jgi:small subunit ribosomal protein S13|nr:30S ribosomal protein S13 [Patescibacteria group bacterium]